MNLSWNVKEELFTKGTHIASTGLSSPYFVSILFNEFQIHSLFCSAFIYAFALHFIAACVHFTFSSS